MNKLRLILNDQLSECISSLAGYKEGQDIVFFCESLDQATNVAHHKKKLVFLFSAMRHFCQELSSQGFKTHYCHLDDQGNSGDLFQEVEKVCRQHAIQELIVTSPSNYLLYTQIKQWTKKLNIPVNILEDDRFLASPKEFSDWAKGRKQIRMEYFYRDMRKKHQILMDGEEPIGGQWNFDSENRKPPKLGLKIPQTYHSKPDELTQEVMKLVSKQFSSHFGDIEPFHLAVNRKQALSALKLFINERLINFGDYQDAMIENEPWMYHSHISFYLNCGLLLPLECIKAVEKAFKNNQAPLNACEGFIRQILGWREYIRGIYWLKMPEYEHENFFNAQRPLPDFYWGGETKMNCLKQCVTETKQNAYAHHIQRLMVLGNFALLAGLNPKEVNEWFWIVYADAYQWVELPNVSGMILFADGGFLASKPYAAGGSYINKMSNYCQNCEYNVKEKTGSQACPFNYLYWHFLNTNRSKLVSNPRVAMMYRTYDRMQEEKKDAIKISSEQFLDNLK